MEFCFFFFSFLLLVSAIGLILSKNSIYSIIWLIFCIINTSGLFILLKAEFIAMMIIIIHAGAISILFLFINMMINHHTIKIKKKHYSFSILIIICLLINLIFIIYSNNVNTKQKLLEDKLTTNEIGEILYSNKFILSFEITGLSILMASIGFINLINYKVKSKKKQNINKQINTKTQVKLIPNKNDQIIN